MAVKLIRVGNQYNAPLKEYLCDLLTDRDTLDATMGDVVRVIETNETYIKTSSGWKKTNGANDNGESSESTTQPATTTNFVDTIDEIPNDATPGSFYYIIEDSIVGAYNGINYHDAVQDNDGYKLELNFGTEKNIVFDNPIGDSNFVYTSLGEDIGEQDTIVSIGSDGNNEINYRIQLVNNPGWTDYSYDYFIMVADENNQDDEMYFYVFDSFDAIVEQDEPAWHFTQGWNVMGKEGIVSIDADDLPSGTSDNLLIEFPNTLAPYIDSLFYNLIKVGTSMTLPSGLYIISNDGPMLVNDNSEIDTSSINTKLQTLENTVNNLTNSFANTVPVQINTDTYPSSNLNTKNGSLLYTSVNTNLSIAEAIEQTYEATSKTLVIGEGSYTVSPFGDSNPTDGLSQWMTSTTLTGSFYTVNIEFSPYLLIPASSYSSGSSSQTLPYRSSMYNTLSSEYVGVVHGNNYMLGSNDYVVVLTVTVTSQSEGEVVYKYIYSPLNTTVNISLLDSNGDVENNLDVAPGTTRITGSEFSFLQDTWTISDTLNAAHKTFVHFTAIDTFTPGLYMWFDGEPIKIQLDQGE